MKVTCPTCTTSFLAPDEKIRGRLVRYHCRKCNDIIIADGTRMADEVDDSGRPSMAGWKPVPVGGAPAALDPSDAALAPAPPDSRSSGDDGPPTVPNAGGDPAPSPAAGPAAGQAASVASSPAPRAAPNPADDPFAEESSPRALSVPAWPTTPRPAVALGLDLGPALAAARRPVISEEVDLDNGGLTEIDTLPPLLVAPPPEAAPTDRVPELPPVQRAARRVAAAPPRAAPPQELADEPGVTASRTADEAGPASGLNDMQKLAESSLPAPARKGTDADALLGLNSFPTKIDWSGAGLGQAPTPLWDSPAPSSVITPLEPPPPVQRVKPVKPDKPVKPARPEPAVVDEEDLLVEPAKAPGRPPLPTRPEPVASSVVQAQAVIARSAVPTLRPPMPTQPDERTKTRGQRRGLLLALLVAAAVAFGLLFFPRTAPSTDTRSVPVPALPEAARPDLALLPPTPSPDLPSAAAPSASATPLAAAPALSAAPEQSAGRAAGRTAGDGSPQDRPRSSDKPPASATAPATAAATTASPPPPAPAGDLPEFDKGAARTTLTASANSAASCATADGPHGVARVSVTFAPSGRVTQAIVQGPPFAGTPVGSCIAVTFRRSVVPPFSGPAISVVRTVAM